MEQQQQLEQRGWCTLVAMAAAMPTTEEEQQLSGAAHQLVTLTDAPQMLPVGVLPALPTLQQDLDEFVRGLLIARGFLSTSYALAFTPVSGY